jgi:hypothetical protein
VESVWVLGRSESLFSWGKSKEGLGSEDSGKGGRTRLTVFFLRRGLTGFWIFGGSSGGGCMGCTVGFFIMGMIEFCLTGAGGGNFSLETAF